MYCMYRDVQDRSATWSWGQKSTLRTSVVHPVSNLLGALGDERRIGLGGRGKQRGDSNMAHPVCTHRFCSSSWRATWRICRIHPVHSVAVEDSSPHAYVNKYVERLRQYIPGIGLTHVRTYRSRYVRTCIHTPCPNIRHVRHQIVSE